MSGIVVFRATAENIEELLPLVEQYRAFYRQPANAKTRDFVTERMVNDEAIVFLARWNERAVGFILIYPTFSTVSLSSIWLLNDLYVDESVRRQGIASKLMDVAEQAARDAGAARIFLRTANDNTPAQALYESRGWTPDTVFRRYDLML
jgi:ribosomal protein S18 acetylase RimI-like enzyme